MNTEQDKNQNELSCYAEAWLLSGWLMQHDKSSVEDELDWNTLLNIREEIRNKGYQLDDILQEIARHCRGRLLEVCERIVQDEKGEQI